MKKERKKTVRLFMLCLFIIGALGMLGSCGKTSEEAKKLQTALEEGNYQGAVEALRDYEDIDLEHLGTKTPTWFSDEDERALALVSDQPKFISLLIDSEADANHVLDDSRK